MPTTIRGYATLLLMILYTWVALLFRMPVPPSFLARFDRSIRFINNNESKNEYGIHRDIK
jgi:hypothetical protein